MKFNDIIGQEAIINALKSAWKSSKISHAYLFEGPCGIGKKTVARVFAKRLICQENPQDLDACGECENCAMFEAGTHPDFKFFSTDSETIKVDEIRDLFEDVHIMPYYTDRKVYIIDGADKMNLQAQNCILKTLEEPPAYAVIILAAHNPDMLLETIQSRVIRYSFTRYRREEIMAAVGRYCSGMECGYSPDFIYSFSDGVIGKALDIVGNENFKSLRDLSFNIIEDIESRDTRRRIKAADAILGTENAALFIEFFMSFYRDLLVSMVSEEDAALINLDKKDFIRNRKYKLSKNRIIKIFNLLREALLALQGNANESLLVESLLFKLQEEYSNG